MNPWLRVRSRFQQIAHPSLIAQGSHAQVMEWQAKSCFLLLLGDTHHDPNRAPIPQQQYNSRCRRGTGPLQCCSTGKPRSRVKWCRRRRRQDRRRWQFHSPWVGGSLHTSSFVTEDRTRLPNIPDLDFRSDKEMIVLAAHPSSRVQHIDQRRHSPSVTTQYKANAITRVWPSAQNNNHRQIMRALFSPRFWWGRKEKCS